ncbi:unnamed protein product [Mytilus coruscus]|uniref:Integrase zinc-binding domain-containing protein n=1 Tax=Mytilus coruscus TaxID=42192 RepID=A0A6J8CL67_MYTCO|nr:unnamed protein product [Mytilus coruscus]
MVPAKHEVVVKSGLTRKVGDTSLNIFGVLYPERSFMKNNGLALARVLVNASYGLIYARLFNATSTDIILYKGTHMALFVPVMMIGENIEVEFDNVDVCHIDERKYKTDEILPQYMDKMFLEGKKLLTQEQSDQFKKALMQYKDVFANPDGKPGKTLQILADEVENLKKKGSIEKSCSPWSAPNVLVQKKDSSWRLCVDYRKINEKTIKDAYLIPGIEDNLDALTYPSVDGGEFILDCAASQHSIGAVLSQMQNGQEKFNENEGANPVFEKNVVENSIETIVNAINDTSTVNANDTPKQRGRRPNVPKRAKQREQPSIDVTPTSVFTMQQEDKDLSEIETLKLNKAEKPTLESFVNKSQCFKLWIQKWELLQIKDKMLCYYWEDSEKNKRWRICTPKVLQKYVLWHIHDSPGPIGGHQGITRSCKRAKLFPFYWPKMNQRVTFAKRRSNHHVQNAIR